MPELELVGWLVFRNVILKDFLFRWIVFEILFERLVAHDLLFEFQKLLISDFLIAKSGQDFFHSAFDTGYFVPYDWQELQDVISGECFDEFLLYVE